MGVMVIVDHHTPIVALDPLCAGPSLSNTAQVASRASVMIDDQELRSSTNSISSATAVSRPRNTSSPTGSSAASGFRSAFTPAW